MKSQGRYSSGKKFIYKIRYAELLKNPLWHEKRLKIFRRDNFTCQSCSESSGKLNVHHLKYTNKFPWDSPDEDLITFCEDCHDIWFDLFQDDRYDIFKLIMVMKYYVRHEDLEITKSLKQ